MAPLPPKRTAFSSDGQAPTVRDEMGKKIQPPEKGYQTAAAAKPEPAERPKRSLSREDPMAGFISRPQPQARFPNRFNIMAGVFWDGIDRSNGFEGKAFAYLREKDGGEEERYRLRTQDM